LQGQKVEGHVPQRLQALMRGDLAPERPVEHPIVLMKIDEATHAEATAFVGTHTAYFTLMS